VNQLSSSLPSPDCIKCFGTGERHNGYFSYPCDCRNPLTNTTISNKDFKSKPNMFIGDKEIFNILLKDLNLICDEEERKNFVSRLYPHIEFTRRQSFKNGYDQGVFDEKISWLNQGKDD